MEKTVGVHRGRELPRFHRQTFEKWWATRHGPPEGTPRPARKVALFPTCFVNWNDPSVGKAAVRVLEHNRCAVSCPPTRCCGMPALDGGDIPAFEANARANIDVMLSAVEDGCDIVVPGPTCSYVIKNEYPTLLSGRAAEDAKRVSERTFDVCEYLIDLKRKNELDLEFRGEVPGKVAYHLPCHLKVQKIGYRSRDVLKLLPGTKVEMIDRCSAMDGTWGMKSEYYELSKKVAAPLFEDVKKAEADAVVTDCPLAGIQIADGTGERPVHPVKILQRAYGLPEE